MKTEQILHLTLSTGQHFYFGSLEAMFRFVTPEQIGRNLNDFYRNEPNFKKTGNFANNLCTLKRVDVIRAKQKGKAYEKV